jgi:hypothetical protein
MALGVNNVVVFNFTSKNVNNHSCALARSSIEAVIHVERGWMSDICRLLVRRVSPLHCIKLRVRRCAFH